MGPTGLPCLKRISHWAPSRLTVATSSFDSALTTLGADAVQAAGRLVAAVLELAAGVEDGEDDLERAFLRGRVLVDRDPAAVVFHRDRRAIGMERDPDVRGEAVHRLVDGVVENFPDEVVQSGRADAADIHAGALPDRLESLENGDVFGGVVGGGHGYNCALKRALLVALCSTIVAAFEGRLAAAAAVSEDVPVPGGRAAVAQALGFDAVPDRGRFVAELTRLVEGFSPRKRLSVPAILQPLTQQPATELVPLR